MFEDRDKQIQKNDSSIEKKTNVIDYKMLRLTEMVRNKTVAMFKNKFNADLIKVRFVEKSNNHFSSSVETPDIIIYYGEYEFKLNNKCELHTMSSWSSYDDETNDIWYDFITIIGVFASHLKAKKSIYYFILSKMEELDSLYLELDTLITDSRTYKDESDKLKGYNAKRIVESLIEDGLRFDIPEGTWISNYRNVTTIKVIEKKNKTYQCEIFGEKLTENFSMRWHDVYLKHDDLHSKFLNKLDCNVDFKRKFNLELSIDE